MSKILAFSVMGAGLLIVFVSFGGYVDSVNDTSIENGISVNAFFTGDYGIAGALGVALLLLGIISLFVGLTRNPDSAPVQIRR